MVIQETKKFNIFPQQFTPDLCTNMEMIDGKRIYTTNTGNKYPSITTILSATMELDKANILKNWQERLGEEESNKVKEDAAERGTALHNLVEKYIFGQDYEEELKNSIPLVRKMFGQIKREIDKNLDNVRLVEKPLYCDSLKCCGRVDIIGEWKGKLAIIDLKTSTRVKTVEEIGDYLLQELFYSICYSTHFNEKIENIVTIVATENSLRAKIFVDTPKKYLTKLMLRIKKYYQINKSALPL